MTVFFGLMIRFLVPLWVQACVFFLKNRVGDKSSEGTSWFASGVMVAASVWSCWIPPWSCLLPMEDWTLSRPAEGLLAAWLFLLLIDRMIPHLHMGAEKAEGPSCSLKISTMLVLAGHPS